MQNRSPNSRRGKQQSFKKSATEGDRPAFKKNTDGARKDEGFRRKDERPGAGKERGDRPAGERSFDKKKKWDDNKPRREESKPFRERNNSSDDKEPFKGKERGDRPYGERANFKKKGSEERQPREERPFRERNNSFGDKKPFKGKERADRPYSERSGFKKKDGEDREQKEGPFRDRNKSFGDKESFRGKERPAKPYSERSGYKKKDSEDREHTGDSRPFRERNNSFGDKDSYKGKERAAKPYSERSGYKKKDNEERQPGEDRPFRERSKSFGDKEPFKGKERSDKPYAKRAGFKKNDGGDRPRKEDSRPFRDRKPFEKKERSAGKSSEREDKKKAPEKPAFDKLLSGAFVPEKKKKDEFSKPHEHEDKVYGLLEDVEKTNVPVRPFKAKKKSEEEDAAPQKKESRRKKKYHDEDEEEEEIKEEAMPLNKYIAHSGECSRRDAAELVKQGKVKVNGELVLDPGYKVKPDDQVTLVGKKLKPTKNNVYILLNKPKGYITTNDDPQGRKTVMELVEGAGVDRLFPVGRLDRETSGLLLITNDGDLTQKLSHPSYDIKKVYQVTLDKPLTKADFEKIISGVELEDGKAIVDEIAYLESKSELGLEIHSGRNRIVRRIFESLGYVVEKLDRMMYAGLTKKNLPRGKWRFLDAREIVLLKHFKS